MGRASSGKKQGWVSDPVTLRSRYNLGVAGVTLELQFSGWTAVAYVGFYTDAYRIWVLCWAFKVKLSHCFSFLLSDKYLLIIQYIRMSVATCTSNSLVYMMPGGFFFLSKANHCQQNLWQEPNFFHLLRRFPLHKELKRYCSVKLHP